MGMSAREGKMAKLQCVICKRGPAEGLAVFRINAKGVPGLWACRQHIGQTDAPAIDPITNEIVRLIEGSRER